MAADKTLGIGAQAQALYLAVRRSQTIEILTIFKITNNSSSSIIKTTKNLKKIVKRGLIARSIILSMVSDLNSSSTTALSFASLYFSYLLQLFPLVRTCNFNEFLRNILLFFKYFTNCYQKVISMVPREYNGPIPILWYWILKELQTMVG